MNVWKRSDISACYCDDLSYRHVHCPCPRCCGRATPRITELRHWKEAVFMENAEFEEHTNISRIDVQDINNDISNEMEIDSETASIFIENQSEDLHLDEDLEEEQSIDSDTETDTECVYIDDSAGGQEVKNPLRKIVLNAVLDAMTISDASGASRKTFEDILAYGKKMFLSSVGNDVDLDVLAILWPKNWNDAQRTLKEEGFKEAKEYYICICRDKQEITRHGTKRVKYKYSGKWSVMESKDDLCGHCGNQGYIKYYYLGLEQKVKHWFQSESMAKKMLSHWAEKDHWLGRQSSWPLKKEFWDGQRWLDLQWFWNPDEVWPLPTKCIYCESIVPIDIIAESPLVGNNSRSVECPNCLSEFCHVPKMARGSPLNVGLIGHWDGWQPFSTSLKSCGAFEVSVANLYKTDRNQVDEIYVVGFVPCSLLPNEVPSVYDPFLQPLINDLCTGFIDGYQVPYPWQFSLDNFEPAEEETVRILLLCWTADHPGQCEIGKFLNQGKCACRRCLLVGQQSDYSNRYYYGQNRYHSRYPWGRRDIKLFNNILYDLDTETRSSVRKKFSSNTGFTGTSILHKYLYPLYEFDILKHMVFDVFHTLPLNLCKNQFQRVLDLEFLDTNYLDEEIKNFPWTKELKNGRIPKEVGKDGKNLGYWKAETFQKFSFPFFECIIDDKFNNIDELEIQCSVSRFMELHFYSGRNGWTDDMINFHKKLAERINIQIEEVQGLNMCTISVHNLLHIHEDILNFGASDNYWCASFERAVKEYINNSHNCKAVEATFAKAESRREFLKSLHHVEVPQHGKFDINQGIASSLDAAKTLCNATIRQSFIIGSTSNVEHVSAVNRKKIADSLFLPHNDIRDVAIISKRCYVKHIGYNGTLLTGGESVICQGNQDGHEIVLTIQRFLSVCCGGGYCQIICEGIPLPYHLDDDGEKVVNCWSGFSKVNLLLSEDKSFFSVRNVRRKIILYNCGNNLGTVGDYMREPQVLPHEITVPVYPVKNDMLLIQGQNSEDVWYGQVIDVNFHQKTLDVYFWVENQRNPEHLVRESSGRRAANTVHFDSLIALAEGEWTNNNCWKKKLAP